MPVLRPKVLSIKIRSKLLETFVKLVLLYGLSTLVYHKLDDNKFRDFQNTAWRMMPDLLMLTANEC